MKLHEQKPPLKPQFAPARDRSRASYKNEG